MCIDTKLTIVAIKDLSTRKNHIIQGLDMIIIFLFTKGKQSEDQSKTFNKKFILKIFLSLIKKL